ETFYKCKNGFSFFDAIDGDKIWAREEVGKKLSALRVSKFRRRLRNIYVNPKALDMLKGSIADVKVVSKHLLSGMRSLSSAVNFKSQELESALARMFNGTEELIDLLIIVKDLLTDMSSRSKRDKFSRDIQSQLDQAEMAIITSVAKLLVPINFIISK
ncbi:hypothetical protein GCK32_010851, partial [Trichostrongylus colubriformis]